MTTGHLERVHHARPAQARRRRPGSAVAVARVTARLVRRRTLLVAGALAAWMAFEAVAFTTGYPDQAARDGLLVWGEDPGLRMIAGWPTAVNTLGGFAVWDAGLYLTLITGAWALTTSTWVLRGDEDAGRAELLLAGPVCAGRALLAQLLVLFAGCAVIGAAIGLALLAAGAQPAGSLLYGAIIAGYGAALVGVAAVASQVFGSRGRALGTAAGVLGGWLLVRMVSNSEQSRTWLGWLTAPGWLDHVRAFGDNRWWVLLVPLAVTTALAATAVALRQHRDEGVGLLAEATEHRSRGWGLGSPLGFAWRTNLGVLVGWAVGIALIAGVVGTMLPAIEEAVRTDQHFQDLLVRFGMSAEDLTLGFAALWAVTVGLVVAVYTAFRMGAARAEEAAGRAEHLLTRPVPRWRWLGGHVGCALVSTVGLTAVGAAALWLGAAATGARLTAADSFAAMANTLPMVTVFLGLAVLTFGVVPRATVAVAAAAAGAAYLLETVGPLLEWPSWVVGLSPFHHVAAVPLDPVGWPAALVMVAVGTALAAVGIAAFERRDVVGA